MNGESWSVATCLMSFVKRNGRDQSELWRRINSPFVRDVCDKSPFTAEVKMPGTTTKFDIVRETFPHCWQTVNEWDYLSIEMIFY